MFINGSIRFAILAGRFLLITILGWLGYYGTIGNYSIFMAIITVGVYLAGYELHTQCTKDIVRADEDVNQTISKHISSVSTLSLIISPAISYILYIYFKSVALVVFGALFFIAECYCQELIRYLIATKKQMESNVALFIRTSCWIPFALACVFHNENASLHILLIFNMFGSLGCILYAKFKLRLPLELILPKGTHYFGENLKTGSQYTSSALLAQSQNFLDRFVIHYFSGSELLGGYVLLQSITYVIQSMTLGVVTSNYTPLLIENLLSENRYKEIVRCYEKSCIYMALIASIPIIIYVFIFNPSKELGPENVQIFILLLVASCFSSFGFSQYSQLYVKGEDKLLLITNAAAFIVYFVLLILFIYFMGLLGAAMSVLITSIAQFIFRRLIIKRGVTCVI